MTFAYTPTPSARPDGDSWSDALRRTAFGLGPAAVALVVTGIAMLLGWRGVDQAAQTYRVTQFSLHGLMLWDSGWYAGNFPLGYSVLFPPVGALLGMKVVAVASAVVATWSFDRMVRSVMGARPLGTWYFAVSTLMPVMIGQWPFLAGEAAGLAALVSLQRGRRAQALILGLVAGGFSPLAAAFLGMALIAWAALSTRRRWLIATALAASVVIVAIALFFPGDGPFPFPWTGLVPTELLCLTAMTPLVRTTPVVRVGAGLYAASTLFSFVVPNPLGGNAPRLAASIGIPLLACFLTTPGPALGRLSNSTVARWASESLGRSLNPKGRWRYATAAILVPFALWQWAGINSIITSPSTAPYTQASFYKPLVSELQHLHPAPMRVEVVPTSEHWESAYVAPYVPIARGWERQLDIADNPIFYTPGALNATSYRTWLDQEGVSYVALPDAPLDYAAKAEAALVSSGQVPDVTLVWHTHNWKLWAVHSTPGLVSGPGILTSLEPDHFTLQASKPGRLTVRVRYTNYWAVTSGQACVSAAPLPSQPVPGAEAGAAPPYQWTQVTALSAGTVEVSAAVVHPAPLPACPTH
jgi:hypothetical protein